MTTILVNTQRTVNAHFLTQDGSPALVDGVPVWSVSNPDVVEIIPTSSGFSVKLRGLTEGTCEVRAVADADRGEGVREVSLSALIQVVYPEATGGEFSFSEPEPVPAPAPAPEPELPAIEELPVAEQAAVEEVLNDATPFVPETPSVEEPVTPDAPVAEATPAPVDEAPPTDPPLAPDTPEADRPT